jgi:hypothetical protein
MLIAFDFGYVFRPDSDPVDDSQALQACLEFQCLLGRRFLRRCTTLGIRVPPLYEFARYHRTDDWLPYPMLVRYGRGDCKSLGPARAAEIRESGRGCEMVHRWIIRPDGGKDFHILLSITDARGNIVGNEDPSKRCGMTEE